MFLLNSMSALTSLLARGQCASGEEETGTRVSPASGIWNTLRFSRGMAAFGRKQSFPDVRFWPKAVAWYGRFRLEAHSTVSR